MNTAKIKHDYQVWPCRNIPQPNCAFYPSGTLRLELRSSYGGSFNDQMKSLTQPDIHIHVSVLFHAGGV